ncbi:Condensin-2 complex subunit H2 [Lamellibrachia satsuma]|nr:Condensin-2 complex subunit H2 [Lamellibrachia satsuma]
MFWGKARYSKKSCLTRSHTMPASSQQTGPDSRFQHLLQPIRDLTKNWNVDIASQLDEYLAEIEQISISFDGGTTTMNFAEAALLIQGSACIYSKKVEYLCSLVHEVLGSLANRKKALAARDENAEGRNEDGAAEDDKDEEFLVLDDIQEMKNIDAKTDAADLTQGTIQNIPKTPLALIPLEETEKEGEPLLNRAGEVIASRSDFNMNLGLLHSTGVILLDMSHLSLLEHSMKSKPSSTPFVPRTVATEGQDARTDPDDEEHIEGLPLNDITMEDINDGGCGVPEDAEAVEPSVMPREQRYCMRENARTRHPVAPPTRQPVEAWLPLNPHISSNTAEKPFRKGRTSRLPPSLKKDAEKRRKRKKEPEEKAPRAPLPSIADFCTQAFYSYSSKYPSNPLKVPSYPEFEHLFWLELRRRQTQAKLDRKRLSEMARGRSFVAGNPRVTKGCYHK